MSHDISHDIDAHDAQVPVSLGVAPAAWWFLIISIAIAVMQGVFVIASSGFGRIWPAANSVKLPL